MAQQYVWPPSAANISGTVPVSGTVTVANEITGTIATLASVTNIAGGTIAIQTGTLASITNVAGGTVAISTGTLATITTVASITNLAGGTVAISGTPVFAGGVLIASGSTTSGTGVLVSQDVSAYSSISIQCIFTGTAGFTFECSNDNTTFFSVVLGYISGSGAPISVLSSNNIVFGPVSYRYFRVRASSWVSGTASAFLVGMTGAQTDPGLRSVGITNTVPVTAVGTVTVNTGTIASITNVATGTIASVTNVVGGTIAISTGTIASITNLAGGTVSTTQVKSSTGGITTVAGTVSAVTILAANANRKGFTIYNNSSGTCFTALGTTATTGLFTVAIPPFGYYEQPNLFVFQGSVTGIWSATNGSASITEFT